MRLLDRYLLRELLTPFCYCLMGILIFWISFDLYSELNEFQRNHLNAVDVLQFYLVQLPEMLVFPLLPVVLLLALLYALTNHARHHELTAMRAAGISLWRLSLPYLAVGFSFSVCLLLLNERWVPNSLELADQIRKGHVDSNAADRHWQADVRLHN